MGGCWHALRGRRQAGAAPVLWPWLRPWLLVARVGETTCYLAAWATNQLVYSLAGGLLVLGTAPASVLNASARACQWMTVRSLPLTVPVASEQGATLLPALQEAAPGRQPADGRRRGHHCGHCLLPSGHHPAAHADEGRDVQQPGVWGMCQR